MTDLEIEDQAPKRRKSVHVDLDYVELLSVVLEWIKERPPFSTSNLALTCRRFYQQLEYCIRTDRRDVTLDNLDWFEWLGESRYELCKYAAKNRDTNFIDKVIPSNQVTQRTFDSLLDSVAKLDSVDMFNWLKSKFTENDFDDAPEVLFESGSVNILFSLGTTLPDTLFDLNLHFNIFSSFRKSPPEFAFNHEWLRTSSLHWPLVGLKELIGIGVELDICGIYDRSIQWDRLDVIEWIWQNFSHKFNLVEQTTVTLKNFYKLPHLDTFQLLHKRCPLKFVEIQKRAFQFGTIEKKEVPSLLWLVEKSGVLLEVTYFAILGTEKIRPATLEKLRCFPFSVDNVQYLKHVKNPKLVQYLFDQGFPKTRLLVEFAIRKNYLELCQFYWRIPEMREFFSWPVHNFSLGESLEFWQWLIEILPICKCNAYRVAKQAIRANNFEVFATVFPKVSKSKRKDLLDLIKDCNPSYVFLTEFYTLCGTIPGLSKIWPESPVPAHLVAPSHRKYVLDFWSQNPLILETDIDAEWIDDYDTYVRLKHIICSAYDRTPFFAENWSERDFQLYLSSLEESE